MTLFRVPYRWLPRTAWSNIRWIVGDILSGFVNVWRWLPVIWLDADYDWCYLAKIMEYKLSRMAKVFDNGHLVNHDRCAKQTRTCAALLRRLDENNYFENAGYNPDAWDSMAHDRKTPIAMHAQKMREQDKRYLGLLIGKYLNHWWD